MPRPSAAGRSSRAWHWTSCARSPIPRSWPTYVGRPNGWVRALPGLPPGRRGCARFGDGGSCGGSSWRSRPPRSSPRRERGACWWSRRGRGGVGPSRPPRARGGGGPAAECIGGGPLRVDPRALAALAGLAVRRDWRRPGVGGALLAALIAEARARGLAELLALPRKPAFFLKVGFAPAEREHFPLKVWADCERCPRNDCCDEIAVSLRL